MFKFGSFTLATVSLMTSLVLPGLTTTDAPEESYQDSVSIATTQSVGLVP